MPKTKTVASGTSDHRFSFSVFCHKDSQSLNLVLGSWTCLALEPGTWSLEPGVRSDPSWMQAVVLSSHILAGFLLRNKKVSVSCLFLSTETPQQAGLWFFKEASCISSEAITV